MLLGLKDEYEEEDDKNNDIFRKKSENNEESSDTFDFNYYQIGDKYKVFEIN